MSEKDGGPAFPFVVANTDYDFDPGMTLRDYFAAKAMQGMTHLLNPIHGSNSDHNKGMIDFIVRSSSKIADEMLKERDK